MIQHWVRYLLYPALAGYLLVAFFILLLILQIFNQDVQKFVQNWFGMLFLACLVGAFLLVSSIGICAVYMTTK